MEAALRCQSTSVTVSCDACQWKSSTALPCPAGSCGPHPHNPNSSRGKGVGVERQEDVALHALLQVQLSVQASVLSPPVDGQVVHR